MHKKPYRSIKITLKKPYNAYPNNRGITTITVDTDLQSDVETLLTALGYGCRDYILELVEEKPHA